MLALGVCFDNVFSYLWRKQVHAGATSLLLVTNNSWYHLASGIRQHCDIDILRAVEFRRPLARVSTTGWSHLISPTGQVLEETEPYRAGLINTVLRPSRTITPYLVLGDLFAQLCLLGALVLVVRALFWPRSEAAAVTG